MSESIRRRNTRGRRTIGPAAWLRLVALPVIGIGFVVGAGWVVTGALAVHTSPALATTGSLTPSTAHMLLSPDVRGPRVLVAKARDDAKGDAENGTGARVIKTASLDFSGAGLDRSPGVDAALGLRFDAVVKQAALSPEKLAKAFGAAAPPASKVAKRTTRTAGAPSPERFAAGVSTHPAAPAIALAFADPSPRASAGALAALSAVAPLDPNSAAVDVSAVGDETEYDPEFVATPDATPVPGSRPTIAEAVKATARALEEDDTPLARRALPKAQKPAAGTKLAYARPDKPQDDRSPGGIGNLFNNFFNRPKAGGGVAVYDISAAKVYMPDGSVLEAHSGIGEMADNPAYVRHRMRGPTPPHTYNLVMREKRFHGVEAIRMLPVDGKNKYGRDGFLTHSYLLRGGRAESHGCVAFKDYNRFLNAFKKGKVKQLVVVPGGGKGVVRVARNGRDT